MIADEGQAWRVYLTLNELVKSVLCLTLAQHLPTFRVYGRTAAIWFVTQAADELTGTNIFQNHQWEYLLLAVVTAALWVYQKRTR